MLDSEQILIDTQSYLNLKKLFEVLYTMDKTTSMEELAQTVWPLLTNIMILEPVTGFNRRNYRGGDRNHAQINDNRSP